MVLGYLRSLSKSGRLLFVIGILAVGVVIAAHQTFHPVGRQAELDVQYHPYASFAGAFSPWIVAAVGLYFGLVLLAKRSRQ